MQAKTVRLAKDLMKLLDFSFNKEYNKKKIGTCKEHINKSIIYNQYKPIAFMRFFIIINFAL
jgi:hypothetical protein